MNSPEIIPAPPRETQGAFAAHELLRKKMKAGKFSFFLGLAFFTGVFVFFLFHLLPSLTLNVPLAGGLGFAFGLFYLLVGPVWGILWALVVQLNLIIDEVAGWVQAVLNQAIAALRQQFVSGVVIDLEIVEAQVQSLVTAQTSKLLAQDNPLLPLVNQWAPIAAREGLRFTVMRVAGPLWSGNLMTLDTLEKQSTRLSLEETAANIRPWLRFAMGIVLLVGLLLAIIPLGIAYGIAALLQS